MGVGVVQSFEMLGQLEGAVDVVQVDQRRAVGHLVCFGTGTYPAQCSRVQCAGGELGMVFGGREAGRCWAYLIFCDGRWRGQAW